MRRILARWRLRRRLLRLTRRIDPKHFDPTLSRAIDQVVAELETV